MNYIAIICFFAVIILIVLDILHIINLTSRIFMGAYLTFMPHTVWLIWLAVHYLPLPALWIITALILFTYVFFRILITPNRRKAIESFRLYVMRGGRWLLFYAFFCAAIQLAFYIVLIFGCDVRFGKLLAADMLLTLIFIWVLGFVGAMRVLCTSSWLSVVKRVLFIVFINIPIVNMFMMIELIKVSGLEYEYFGYKTAEVEKRRGSDICKTKYPIIMVHGVGFRDLRLFNYWGRIPRVLEENGAVIYYGNQEGWATVDTNAPIIRDTILKVIKETGAEKVNVIAHSKGGLDTRKAISQLGMDKYVASLTTISTPHRGVKMADVLVNMPKPLFRLVTFCINGIFRAYGDKNPDFIRAAYDFTTKRQARFNRDCPDMEGVYYQSYASVMKNPLSDTILWLPNLFISIIDSKDNDGLVTVDSAKWGEFKGVFRNKYGRGISHGDMIDLSRENYRGFDVTEKYVEIVSQLREMGY